MVRRFYVHNFRCLENFELPIGGKSSALLIGNNGSGKSTVGLALEILQKIARGTNRVRDLAEPKDFARGRADIPMRFEIEADLGGKVCQYIIAFELPRNAREIRIFEERFSVDGDPIYSRDVARVRIPGDAKTGLSLAQASSLPFLIDPRLVHLPILMRPDHDPLSLFRLWLARTLILRPAPSMISGDSQEKTLEPNPQGTDFGAWISGLLEQFPSAYTMIERYLKQLMLDFKGVTNALVGKDSRSLDVQFSNEHGNVSIPFKDLSDGEKCFMICAVVLAANEAYGPLFCFWDEPDNYLALPEVGHFVMALRKAFQSGGQFIATSHNPEAIRSFSDENTFVLHRRSHLEPTLVRPLSEINISGDLVDALVRGDVEP